MIDNGQTLTFFEPEDFSYAALAIIGIQPAFAETIGGCLAAYDFAECMDWI